MIIEYSGQTSEQKIKTLRDSVQRALEEVTESYSNDIVKESKETRTIIKVVERQTSSLASGKADIDLLNVNNAWLENGVIVDGAIGSAKIASLSANKITSGTLDCGNITVLNLNAGSINAGALTVGGVTLNVSADTASITGTVIQNGTIPKSSLSTEVQDLLDGAVETFTTDAVPTLSNYPASQWATTAEKETHIGDVCYVVNQSLSENGYSYRFSYLNSVFSWERISDSDVTRALAEIAAMQDDIDGLTTWQTQTISWMGDTDDGIEAVQGRLTTAETDIGNKVDITDFNTLSSTVDSNSASITSLTSAVNSKADSSTVTTLTTKVNSIEQTADGTSSKVSNLITVLGTNSDGTTKTGDVVQRMGSAETAITQNANAITLKANASDVYTKTAIDDEFALYAKLADFTVAPDEISSTITEAISTAEGYTDGALSSALASYYTKSQIDQTVNGINLSIESKQSISGMSAYQTVAGMDAYQTVAGMSSYYTKSDIDLSLGEITLSVEALDEAKMDVSGMSDYQLVADMDDYQTVAGMSDYQTLSGMASYYTKAEIDITNTSITNRITAAETNISGEVTSRTTLIRSFNGGTLTAYQGEPYGVYTNASGSVDIVTLSWNGTTPTITGTVASYGDEISLLGGKGIITTTEDQYHEHPLRVYGEKGTYVGGFLTGNPDIPFGSYMYASTYEEETTQYLRLSTGCDYTGSLMGGAIRADIDMSADYSSQKSTIRVIAGEVDVYNLHVDGHAKVGGSNSTTVSGQNLDSGTAFGGIGCYFDLSPGTYVLSGSISFDGNSSGRRAVQWERTTSGAEQEYTHSRHVIPAGSATLPLRVNSVAIVTIDENVSTQRFSLRAWQNSGSRFTSVSASAKYVRIA